MDEKQVELIKKIYSITIIVLTVLLGVLFIIQALDIYLVGLETGEMYTPDNIWAHFKNVAIPLIIWILGLIFGYILHIISPSKEKFNHKIESKDLVEKMSTALPDEIIGCEEELKVIESERKHRLIAWIITISIVVISSILSVIFLVNPEIYKFEDSFKETGEKFLAILPWLILIFGSLIVVKTFETYSYKNELASIRKILSNSSNKKPVQIIRPTGPSEKIIMTTRVALLLIAIVFIVHGIINGGAYDVFKKATAICMECIGMG